MTDEIEAKIRVRDFTALRRRIAALGGRLLGSAVETDRFFDTPGRRLMKMDCGLRLRTISRPSGSRKKEAGALLTYKGPRKADARAKVRREIQTRLADPRAIADILGMLGLRPSAVVRKHRTTYRLGRCLVELDRLPGLGRFVEIEGPSRAAVTEVRKKLGLAGPLVMESYVRMANRLKLRIAKRA
ncbi:MAG: class IV adenylate cyclase [Planctomycetes bacterium]|nr:class IV adenylate cyclase [Planctomycetota bacterium]